jgi:hypothetical protein
MVFVQEAREFGVPIDLRQGCDSHVRAGSQHLCRKETDAPART